jgi:hypothetical protein
MGRRSPAIGMACRHSTGRATAARMAPSSCSPSTWLELDGTDLRREPIETRKATLASLLRGVQAGLHLNEHFERCSEVGRRRSGGRPRRIGGGSIDGEAERPQTGPRAREGLKSTLTRARAIRAAAPRAVPEESTS